MIKYVGFLLLLTVLAIVYGRIIFLVAKRKFFPVLVRKVMNYSTLSKEEIENSLLGIVYYVYPALAITCLCLIFRYPFYRWFQIRLQDTVYIPIAMLAFISVMSCVSGIAGVFSPKTNWVEVISNVSWIVSVNTRRNSLKFMALVLGAFVEELLFRGVCFGMVYYLFPQYSVWGTLIFSAVLFGVQQSLFASQKEGKFIFLLSGFSMGLLAGCFMLYTESIWPSLIAHECFVFFYFTRFGFKR